jgi:glycine dehydrogenase subunit 1
MLPYVPGTLEDRQQILSRLGLDSVEELFQDIPEEIVLKRPLSIGKNHSELEIAKKLKNMGDMNSSAEEFPCFLGAGAYDHFIPSSVRHVVSRSEFYTAYTPYQPEISQGTLQAIFEYQSMICAITGMDISNASLYDGASGAVEAALMAVDATRRNKIVVSETVNPEYRRVLDTFMGFRGIEVVNVAMENGVTELQKLDAVVDGQTAAVLFQTPNFFGIVEDAESIEGITHKHNALMIMIVDPISMGMLKPPGELGADIAVGEGQSLGNPMSFGGPYLGFITCTKALTRRMPGRIVGETKDKNGGRGFVSTLQTREQHIRREKASSNICSNQALNALAACVYLAAMGKKGLKEVAEQCYHKAHYAKAQLTKTGKYRMAFNAPFFKEFAVKGNTEPEVITNSLLAEGIIGGYDLTKNYPALNKTILYCVTEKRTKEEIDKLAMVLEGIE